MIRSLTMLAALAALAGCSSSIQEVGREPALSPVGYGIDPAVVAQHNYPNQPVRASTRHSLWNDRQSNLFTDARALSPGDILTVTIQLNDKASFNNQSDRSRNSNRKFGLSASGDVNGASSEGAADLSLDSTSASKGSGATTRSESVRLSIAAVVTDVLPNGNLVIRGSQEVRLNAELRILTIAGIVRPTDIRGSNTIAYDRIAEARISYGGRGRLTEVQQPAYGQQILDIVSPF